MYDPVPVGKCNGSKPFTRYNDCACVRSALKKTVGGAWGGGVDVGGRWVPGISPHTAVSSHAPSCHLNIGRGAVLRRWGGAGACVYSVTSWRHMLMDYMAPRSG